MLFGEMADSRTEAENTQACSILQCQKVRKCFKQTNTIMYVNGTQDQQEKELPKAKGGTTQQKDKTVLDYTPNVYNKYP